MLVFTLSTLLATASVADVVVNKGKFEDFYHIEFELTDKNSRLALGSRENEFHNGMFEVYIDKKQFPIPAPNCRSHIILRMPLSIDDNNMQIKKQLYDEIKSVYTNKTTKLIVTELNPYMTIDAKNRITLSHCNVFFRHANDGYINHLNPIDPKQAPRSDQ